MSLNEWKSFASTSAKTRILLIRKTSWRQSRCTTERSCRNRTPTAFYIQDGKLTELNVDCLQRTGLIWMEVCLRQQARVYLIYASGLPVSADAGTWPSPSTPTSATVHRIWVQSRPRWRRGRVDDLPIRYSIKYLLFSFSGL